MPRKNLTARFCETVKVEQRTDYQDEMVKGLSLRISPSGAKTWNVRYISDRDSSKERLKLGRFPAMTLEKARTAALKIVMAVSEGDDPALTGRAKREAMTVQDLGEVFIEKYSKRHKKTWQEDQRILNADIYPAIGRMKAISVKRRDIIDILEQKADAGRLSQSTHVLAVLRKMFNWAVENDYLTASPASGIKPRGKAVKRDRILSNDELRSIWNAIPEASLAPQTRDIIKLLFLTGQRSGEVCGLMPAEVDFDEATWTIPNYRTKNGLTHIVPLSDQAIEILSDAQLSNNDPDRPLFCRVEKAIESNAISKAVRLKLQVSEESWTAHDIRRTVATGMAEIGIQPHIVEACLNHISGFRAGVAGVYNRAAYDKEKRRALDMWAEHLESVIGGQPSNVISITSASSDG